MSSEPASDDPGRRQAAWTLRQMLRGPCTRGLDLAAEPRRALLLGGAAASLAEDAAAWGACEITIGPDPELGWNDEDRADLVVAGVRAGQAEEEVASRLRSVTASLCVLLTDRASRVDVTRAARAAGFSRIELVAPPADAERRFIRFDSTLLLAWTGGPS